jgi:hypothetical protein
MNYEGGPSFDQVRIERPVAALTLHMIGDSSPLLHPVHSVGSMSNRRPRNYVLPDAFVIACELLRDQRGNGQWRQQRKAKQSAHMAVAPRVHELRTIQASGG